MEGFHKATCVRFKEKTAENTNYLYITPGQYVDTSVHLIITDLGHIYSFQSIETAT